MMRPGKADLSADDRLSLLASMQVRLQVALALKVKLKPISITPAR